MSHAPHHLILPKGLMPSRHMWRKSQGWVVQKWCANCVHVHVVGINTRKKMTISPPCPHDTEGSPGAVSHRSYLILSFAPTVLEELTEWNLFPMLCAWLPFLWFDRDMSFEIAKNKIPSQRWHCGLSHPEHVSWPLPDFLIHH